MNFKSAIFISVVGHCCVLAPLGNMWFLTPNKKIADVQIVYYKINPPTPVANPTKAAAIPKEEHLPPPTPNQETITIEKSKLQKSQIIKKARPKQIKASTIKPQEAAPTRENVLPSSIPGTTLPNTLEGTRYYQYIKETILEFFKKNYLRNYEEGIVSITFVINNTGELRDFGIIEGKSSSNSVLRGICSEGIRDASPFKPFPKNLSLKQYTFSFAVIFKQE